MENTTESIISTYGIENLDMFVGKADLVSLVNQAYFLLNNIDSTKAFGSHFMSLDISKTCKAFLDKLSKIFEDNYINDTKSYDYRTSHFVWLQSNNSNRSVLSYKYRRMEIKNSSLITVMTSLIGQLRQKLFDLPRRPIQSAYILDLIDEFEKLLKMIPEPTEKSIFVIDRDRNNNRNRDRNSNRKNTYDNQNNNNDNENENENDLPKKQIFIMDEPFIEELKIAFTESKNAQRVATAKSRIIKQADYEKKRLQPKEKTERGSNEDWEKVGRGGRKNVKYNKN